MANKKRTWDPQHVIDWITVNARQHPKFLGRHQIFSGLALAELGYRYLDALTSVGCSRLDDLGFKRPTPDDSRSWGYAWDIPWLRDPKAVSPSDRQKMVQGFGEGASLRTCCPVREDVLWELLDTETDPGQHAILTDWALRSKEGVVEDAYDSPTEGCRRYKSRSGFQRMRRDNRNKILAGLGLTYVDQVAAHPHFLKATALQLGLTTPCLDTFLGDRSSFRNDLAVRLGIHTDQVKTVMSIVEHGGSLGTHRQKSLYRVASNKRKPFLDQISTIACDPWLRKYRTEVQAIIKRSVPDLSGKAQRKRMSDLLFDMERSVIDQALDRFKSDLRLIIHDGFVLSSQDPALHVDQLQRHTNNVLFGGYPIVKFQVTNMEGQVIS